METENAANKTSYLSLASALLACFGLAGAAVYLLFRLDTLGIVIGLMLGAALFGLLSKLCGWRLALPELAKPKLNDWLWLGIYLSGFAWGTMLLFSASTDQAITSPWQVVSPWFFFVWLVLWLISARLSLAQRPLATVTVFLQYLLSFSVAAVVYRLGYGFDPFIHQAASKYISEHGAVAPKTLYYSGQYAVELFVRFIFRLPINVIDVWLVPLLAAAFLPPAVRAAAHKIFHHQQAISLLPLLLLILPYGLFIITTPQNLGYLAAILAVLAGLTANKKTDLPLPWLLAAFAFVCQPIAGLPVMIFLLTLMARQVNFRSKEWLYGGLLAANAVGLPLIFYLLEKTPVNWLIFIANLLESIKQPSIALPRSQGIMLDFAYLYGFNVLWLLLLLILAGAILIFRNGRLKYLGLYLISLGHAVSLICAYWLTRGLDFSYLIDYERSNYANRLLIMASIIALPIMLVAFYEPVKRVLTKNWSLDWRRGFLLAAGLIALFSLYYSYPRKDNFYNSRGFNVTAADISAAQSIDQNSQGVDYIVLSNQQTSAAALKLYGFAKYYNDLFYYPIPTGGKLYDYFLTMCDQPSKQTADSALSAAGVKRLYYVVPKYWWQAEKLIAEAQASADDWWSVADGQNYIFVYQKP